MRFLFLGLLIGLAAVQLVWHGPPAATPVGAIPLVLAAVLLAPAAWIWRGSLRAGVAASFLSLPFMVHGITEFAVTQARIAMLETGLCLFLYVSLILWIAAQRPARAGGSEQS